MGLIQCHNAGTRHSYYVARHTVSEQNKKSKIATNQSYSVVVASPNISTPTNPNQ